MSENQTDWNALLKAVEAEVAAHRGEGRVADYIPALAAVDPMSFGMALVTTDGTSVKTGDADVPFSIQSVSKVFTLALALNLLGERLWRRVGREPSGTAFNSIVQLEVDRGIPRNPLINAGALVVTDVLVSTFGRIGAKEEILSRVRDLSGDQSIRMDPVVAASELETAHRNAGLAHVMKGFGNIRNSVDDVLDVYCHQCAIAMNCVDLARAALFLCNQGHDPLRDIGMVSPVVARRINAIMLTCGHYDAAGDFAYRVGLPGKSGVGGGIIAVVPRRLTVAVWSPGLNENGNSLVGTLALEALVRRSGLAIL